MSFLLTITLAVIATALYKQGKNLQRAVKSRDPSRLKAAALFFFLTLGVAVLQLWLVIGGAKKG